MTASAATAAINQQVVERSRAPRRRGFSGTYDAAARGSNPMCGDDLEVRVCLGRDADGRTVVVRADFEGFACALCTASVDALLEHAIGMTPDDLRLLVPDDLCALLGGVEVRPGRRRCLTLGLEALHACLGQMRPTT